MENSTYSFPIKQKVVFLGDSNVGKTAILKRFTDNTFVESERPTIGIDFLTKTFKIDNRQIKLQLWDTAGQERFRALIPSYIKDCNIAVLVYDITKATSFENIKAWYDDVKTQKGKDVAMFLIGNKIDLSENREVTKEQGEKKAIELEAQFSEVSAKSGENIQTLFSSVATTTYRGIDASSVHISNTRDFSSNPSIIQNNLNKNDEREAAVISKRTTDRNNIHPNNIVIIDNKQNENNKKKNCC